MRRPARRGGAALALGVVACAAAASAPGLAQTAPDSRPPCVRALIAVDENVDSARAKAGDVFKFVIAQDAVAPDGTPLPTGTPGYGVVANATHAGRGGQPGYLALETRFFVAPDGKHVPAIIDRANDSVASAVGSTANAPGALGWIPFVGYAVGGYDALHHGRDATIPRGTRVGVLLGDDAALGTCRPLGANEAPPPMPTVAPSAAPASSAVPAAAASSAPSSPGPVTMPTPPAPAAPPGTPTPSPTTRP